MTTRLRAAQATALTLLAILITIVLALLGTNKAPGTVILLSSIVFAVLTLLLFIPTFIDLMELRSLWSEQRERKKSRTSRKLKLVSGDHIERAPAAIPDGFYGYEVIRAFAGLKSGDARLKPNQEGDTGEPYPLEVRKHDGETYIVGYVSGGERDAIETQKAGSDVKLYMRRQKTAPELVEIPLSQVREKGSRGDGRANNPFHLLLELRPHSSSAAQPQGAHADGR